METGLTPLPMTGLMPADDGANAPARIVPTALSRSQKAAIIVRLLVSEGAKLPLDALPDEFQTALTFQMSEMRLVDRATLEAVVQEFADELEAVGLSFPPGMEGALNMLDGHISAATAARLRREAGVAAKGDPWERLASLDPDRLVVVLEEESVEVGAVLLSKLQVAQAADLLGRLSGERARRLSYAISKTGKVDPDTVRRIGLSLAAQLDAEPVGAFSDGPVARVGAILNSSRSAIREDVLAGLEETDSDFADEVRKAIFTFANIADRVSERDAPRIIKGIEPATLAKALAYAAKSEDTNRAAEHILANISKRMADGLREEIASAGSVAEAVGEEAMAAVIAEVRRLEEAGDLLLVADD